MGEPEAPGTPVRITESAQEPVEFQGYEEGVVAPADSLDMYGLLRFYGDWFWVERYGWVWRPNVTSDWAPMVDGHWAWTEYGWMWVSYEPFGSITYGYGFWVDEVVLGWLWVPDSHSEWAPARCEWVAWDDEVAWCPLPPPDIQYDDPWESGQGPWITVPVAKFKDTQVGHNRVKPRYKHGTSDRTLRRSAPNPDAVAGGLGHGLKVTDVQVIESGNTGYLKRVVLPDDEQAIVDAHRPKGGGSYKNSLRPPTDDGSHGGSGGDYDNPGVGGRPAKGKGSSPPATKNDDPRKFKEKAKDSSQEREKSKPGGESKKEKGER